jgi:hypothetical protein
MKKLSLTLLTCLLFLSPNVVLSVSLDDLVERDGLFYKKLRQVPFSGKITGLHQGVLKNGKRDGAWVWYWGNGQFHTKGNYKNGKQEGAWVKYHSNGQVQFKSTFKNGKRNGAWIRYWRNGQFYSKGKFKNGKQEGAWITYNKDGTVWEEWTGTFKDGKKISD